LLVKKAVVEAEEKENKKAEKKIEKAEKAVKEEEKEVVKEAKADKVVQLEKKEEDAEKKDEGKENAAAASAKDPPYKTLPAKDVHIKSALLKDDCAGHFRQSKDHEIHDHPVWIKVKPAEDRFGWYQAGKWHISDLAKLNTMLKE